MSFDKTNEYFENDCQVIIEMLKEEYKVEVELSSDMLLFNDYDVTYIDGEIRITAFDEFHCKIRATREYNVGMKDILDIEEVNTAVNLDS